MTTLRLLADDLTGALDTTAEFVPLTGAVPVFWPNVVPAALVGSAALDSATRERTADDAATQVRHLCRSLQGADIAYKKIDSLLRGPTLAEIAACMHTGFWRHGVLAPAFPFQARVTQGGRQYAHIEGTWTPISVDLSAALQALGIPACQDQPGSELQPGITVFDAETDSDLRAIAARVQACPGPVLWIGTGGLAQAIAAGRPHLPHEPLPSPILGIFGSDQAATADQLAACGEHWLDIETEALDTVTGRLESVGLALVSFRLPDALPRNAAAGRIADAISQLVARMDLPGTIVAAGGETLRSLCDATGAKSLLVQGRLMPGIARSVIQGGRWDGATVVSKSGAFGPPDLLRRLLLDERKAS